MFEVGKIYNRRIDIHGVYKGQQYGGIATPSQYPYVFIFTSETGEEFGYSDGVSPDGTFRYTGEGQEGDMIMAKGNLAIRDHQKNNKEILLFESVSKGMVRFVGKCNYITHHIEERPDKNGKQRAAYIFHLDFITKMKSDGVESPKASYLKKPTRSKSLKELREIALSSTPTQANQKEKLIYVKHRSDAIKLYAKKRAGGFCEGCGDKAPFDTKSGPYLEVHHLTRLSDGGADSPENVITLCPTCHRRAHYAVDRETWNNELMFKAKAIEKNVV
ncbi:HNH endonuclease [Pseudoalteromonas piratica]|uniref:HNH nuclease n=1 Tax=Pseudoalteromonas piratica TaxID=1348114 RepID=A0A0A7EKV4_9GAMM|nr:HNH endonuclease [Pseudoalteromonas piratica]AIY67325.1 HNH nuclease [Pseudoalteromonas piratica]